LEFRTLGRAGPTVSLVGLGCNNFGGRIDLPASRAVIHRALDLGITLFDTADVYGERGGSETILGQLLGPRRNDIVLASKFGMPMDGAGKLRGASRRYIVAAVEASLKRLQTDWIDHYQIHVPDPDTPIDETMRALDDLVRAGKVRTIGCSNFQAWQVVDAQWTAQVAGGAMLVSCQDEYSLVVRDIERELVPAMRAKGLGLLPYYPLGGGLLTGKYRRDAPMPEGARLTYTAAMGRKYLTAANYAYVERLEQFCAARNRSLVELAFSWLASRPVVSSVIAGATRPAQVEANVRAADWKLTPEELAEVDALRA